MTLGSHQSTIGRSQSHITPRSIIDALGGANSFDLNPCACVEQPWPCAKAAYTERDDGLTKPWRGRVWLNPPFHRFMVAQWIRKLATHGTGTALLHARVETDWFLPCWQKASGILFLSSRINFYRPDGSRHPHNSGAPPLLVSFGAEDLRRLRASNIAGVLTTKWEHQKGS